MPERGFDTAFWTDPFVLKLPLEGKALYSYLWTNSHCNQAGLYEIALEMISFETGLNIESLPELFSLLEPKVVWYKEVDLVWVKNFIKRQSKSPKFLQAAAKCLTMISNNGAVQSVLEYNASKYRISIPYQYYIDKIQMGSDLVWSDLLSSSLPGGEEDSKGKGGTVKKLEEDEEQRSSKLKGMVMENLDDLRRVKGNEAADRIAREMGERKKPK